MPGGQIWPDSSGIADELCGRRPAGSEALSSRSPTDEGVADSLQHAMTAGHVSGLQAAIHSAVRHMARCKPAAGQLPEVCQL